MGATIIALLPPSSSSERPSRAATRGATAPAHRASSRSPRPAARRGSSASCAHGRPPPITHLEQAVGHARRCRSAARCSSVWQASAVSGVCVDGFQITGSPQTSGERRVPAQTATGKLKAVITPTGPSGCHFSIIRWPGPLGGDGQAVELARQADGEVADVDHLLHFAEALLRDLARLERDQRARASPSRGAAPRRAGARARPAAGPAPRATSRTPGASARPRPMRRPARSGRSSRSARL